MKAVTFYDQTTTASFEQSAPSTNIQLGPNLTLKSITALKNKMKIKVKEYCLEDDTPVLSIQSDDVSHTDTSSPSTSHSLAYQMKQHNTSVSASCHVSNSTVGLPESPDSNQHDHSYACFEPAQAMTRDQPEHVSSKAPTADSVSSYETTEKQKFDSSSEANLNVPSGLHEGSHGVTEHEIEDDQLVKSVNINDQETSTNGNLIATQSVDLIGLQQTSELANRKLILEKLNIGSGCQVDVQHILDKDYLLLATNVAHPDLGEISQPDLGGISQPDLGEVKQLVNRHKAFCQPVNRCISGSENIQSLKMVTSSGESVLECSSTVLLNCIPAYVNEHCVMDLNIKLGDNTVNLIKIMKNIKIINKQKWNDKNWNIIL